MLVSVCGTCTKDDLVSVLGEKGTYVNLPIVCVFVCAGACICFIYYAHGLFSHSYEKTHSSSQKPPYLLLVKFVTIVMPSFIETFLCVRHCIL